MHYIASKREDSAFWRDNRDPATIPESLQGLMTLWKHRSPSEYDFNHKREVFSAASYQYVLYGMDFTFTQNERAPSEAEQKMANRMFVENKKITKKYVSALPTNRELITKVHQFGFSKI